MKSGGSVSHSPFDKMQALLLLLIKLFNCSSKYSQHNCFEKAIGFENTQGAKLLNLSYWTCN